jgi:hypothetical protein
MNNPKEKAKELVEVFEDIDNMGRYSGDFGESIWSTIELRKQAKQCALIAVDEILNTLEVIFETYEEREYWIQVKQEIQAL